MASIDDLFAPRGVEAYVPSLAQVRRELWNRLDAEIKLCLEIADYIGLDRALGLKRLEIDELAPILPGRLWHLISKRADKTADHAFEHDRASIIAHIAASIAFTK